MDSKVYRVLSRKKPDLDHYLYSLKFGISDGTRITFWVNFCLAPVGTENGIDGTFKLDPGTQLSIDFALGRKRKVTEGEDSDEEGSEVTAPPVHDIYRSRQQKRAK